MKDENEKFVYVNKQSDELVFRRWNKIKEHIINIAFYLLFILLLFIDCAYSNVLLVSILLTLVFPCYILYWLKTYQRYTKEDYGTLNRNKTIHHFIISMFICGNIFWALGSSSIESFISVIYIAYLLGLLGLLFCYVRIYKEKIQSFFCLSFVFAGIMQSAFIFLKMFFFGGYLYLSFGWAAPSIYDYETLPVFGLYLLLFGLPLIPFAIGIIASICIALYGKPIKQLA